MTEEVKIEESKPTVEDKPIEAIKVEPKSDKRIFISPLAKKLAKEKNININTISGSGENGRIIKIDIENYWKDKSIRFAEINNCVGCFHRNEILLKKMWETKKGIIRT